MCQRFGDYGVQLSYTIQYSVHVQVNIITYVATSDQYLTPTLSIMNHGSGFIIGIARKNCKNPNRTFTKINFKTTLIAFICLEKPLRVSFSVA